MSREGSDAEAGDDLRPLPATEAGGGGGGGGECELKGLPPPPPPPPSGPDEHSIRVAAKRMSFRQSKKQRRQVRAWVGGVEQALRETKLCSGSNPAENQMICSCSCTCTSLSSGAVFPVRINPDVALSFAYNPCLTSMT